MQKDLHDQNDLLYQAILALNSLEECRAFFQDLCTVAELRAMAGSVNGDLGVGGYDMYGADGYKTVLPRLKK